MAAKEIASVDPRAGHHPFSGYLNQVVAIVIASVDPRAGHHPFTDHLPQVKYLNMVASKMFRKSSHGTIRYMLFILNQTIAKVISNVDPRTGHYIFTGYSEQNL